MKVIPNTILPLPGFLAINLFGFVFVRKEYLNKFTEVTKNHEAIHTAQMKELLYIPFYIIYGIEWLMKALFIKGKGRQKGKSAYKRLAFEEEAYHYQRNLDYLENRKRFAMWRRDYSVI